MGDVASEPIKSVEEKKLAETSLKSLRLRDLLTFGYLWLPYWALLGVTGPYSALLGLTRPCLSLLGLTRPYWALLGLTGFYFALLGLTGPN